MTVQTEVSNITDKYASATVVVDNGKTARTYLLFFSLTGGGCVTVATGHAIKLRSAGKTFWNIGEVKTHYKRDGEALLSVVNELGGLIEDKNKLSK